MSGSGMWSGVLTAREASALPAPVIKKLDAHFERTNKEAEGKLKQLENGIAESKLQYEQLKKKIDASENTLKSMKTQLNIANSSADKARNALTSLEGETDEIRKQKNLAIDQRDNLKNINERQQTEIEQLKVDVSDLTSQLKQAIDSKCEALSKNDEILNKASSLEQREQRMDQEKYLQALQIQTLTDDLNKYKHDLQTTRSILNSEKSNHAAEIQEKEEELQDGRKQICRLTELYGKLVKENENLTQRKMSFSEIECEMLDNYKKELEAKTKLSEMYLKMMNESNEKYEKTNYLMGEINLLKNNLENENVQLKSDYENLLKNNNEIITSLKSELENAKIHMHMSKEESLNIFLENLSPNASVTCNLIKKKSLTQVYDQLVKLSDEISNLKKDNAHLDLVVSTLKTGIEEKESKIKQVTVDYDKAIERNLAITDQLDALNAENKKHIENNDEFLEKCNSLQIENNRLKKEITDISRQICYLLHEKQSNNTCKDEEYLGSSVTSELMLSSISKNLITFSDIQELQANNVALIKTVRDLNDKMSSKESIDCKETQSITEPLNKKIADLLESQDHQNKIIDALTSQRDRYQKLYLESNQQKPTVIDSECSNVVSDKQQLLEVELADVKKQVEIQKQEYKKYREEVLLSEKILTEQLQKLQNEFNDLSATYVKTVSSSKTTNEKLVSLERSVATYKSQIVSLEERNKIYNSSIVKQEETIRYLRDEFMSTLTKLTTTEATLETLKQESKFLQDSETRLKKERDLLRKERYSQSLILNDIKFIKVNEKRKEGEDIINIESKLAAVTKECSELNKQIKLQQDKFNDSKVSLDREITHLKDTLCESNNIIEKKKAQINSLNEQLNEKTISIDDLNKRIVGMIANTSQEVTTDVSRKMKELENQLNSRQSQISALQQQLLDSNESLEDYKTKHSSTETMLANVNLAFNEFKKETEIKLEKHRNAEKDINDKYLKLKSELSLRCHDLNSLDGNDLKMELSKARNIIESQSRELMDKNASLEKCNLEVNTLSDSLKKSEEKFAYEMSMHSNDLKMLLNIKEEFSQLKTKNSNLSANKDQLEKEIEKLKINLNNYEKSISEEKQKMSFNIVELKEQNSVLLEQLQIFNAQSQEKKSKTDNLSSKVSVSDSTLNKDNVKSTENLLEVIKHLKNEKEIIDIKFNMINAENTRMKSELELMEKKMLDLRNSLTEKARSSVTTHTLAESSKMTNKIETFNALADSNVLLRKERDDLVKKVKELSENFAKSEDALTNIQNSSRDFVSKIDSLQTENASLKLEISRWRTRVNALVEKANKTSPEDWKRLQNERETLAKKLTSEKETTKRLNEELASLKAQKSNTDEQIIALTIKIANMNDDFNKQTDELNTVKKDITRITQELLEARTSIAEKNEENTKLSNDLTVLTKRELQIRGIARKYKLQYEKLSTSIEEQNTSTETPNPDGNSAKLQIEGNQDAENKLVEMEKTHTGKITELNEQISTCLKKNDALQQEINALKEKQIVLEKEKEELSNIVSKNMHLSTTNENLLAELKEVKIKIESITKAKDECEISLNALKLKYEEDTLKYENDKSRLEVEKRNKISETNRKMEILLQKLNQKQKELNISQSPKPSTSFSQEEKNISETSTTNLKPLIGTAASDISSSQTSSPSVTENLPTSSSTSTQFQEIVAVPPESTQDIDNMTEDTISTPDANQAVTLPRIETSHPNTESHQACQQASSSSNNNSNSTVTTSHRNGESEEVAQRTHKRTRPTSEQTVDVTNKRQKIQRVAESELEYQVPTSSQRDQEDDCVLIVDSGDEENQYQEGLDEMEDDEEKTEISDKLGDQTIEEAATSVIHEEILEDNEVEVIENASQELSIGNNENESIANSNEVHTDQNVIATASHSLSREQQIETISSVTEGTVGGVGSAGVSGSYDESSDSIVPSTPVLYVPRRNDGFGEAVSSPVLRVGIPTGEGCFTFSESAGTSSGVLDDTHADLTSQIAPHLPDALPISSEDKMNESSEAEAEEEVVQDNATDEDAPTVSSQGSLPTSPHQVEEGSEAEASSTAVGNTASRGNWRRGQNQRPQSSNNRTSDYHLRPFSQRSQRYKRPQNQYRRTP